MKSESPLYQEYDLGISLEERILVWLKTPGQDIGLPLIAKGRDWRKTSTWRTLGSCYQEK